jgi:hypothetical protein
MFALFIPEMWGIEPQRHREHREGKREVLGVKYGVLREERVEEVKGESRLSPGKYHLI